ncbi:FAD-dependent monooxygenase [Streptomyces collinus]|uniref:FAD-dependent monooxygenase n=1 Tax=Streptomyces collinus TaxID=42684 RepID=UPI0029436D78|nr:FAD-dependent monooxygenase [Streptomyces collinus]
MNTRATPTAGGRFEVVVAGGGPAGAVTALVLARAGRRVLLVDDRAAPPGTTARLTIGETLPPAARPLLHDLGLWSHVTGGRHLRSTGILASWGSPELYDRSDVRDPNGHGRHLDRNRFDASLRSAAVAAGTELRRAAVVRHHAQGPAQRLLLRREGAFEELLCDWVVDATGRRCVIGRRLAVRHRQDRLVAAYTLLDRRVPHGRGTDEELRTLVEAVPDGWWYTVRVPAGRLVAYLTDSDLAGRTLRTPTGLLAHAARTRHVRTRLEGYASPATAPRWTAAHGLRLSPPTGPGWLATGDAALAFDPLSSQGVLTALHTGAHAGRTVDLCLRGTDTQTLADYTAFLDGIADAYRGHHAHCYGQERRWPTHPFWKRRVDSSMSSEQRPS